MGFRDIGNILSRRQIQGRNTISRMCTITGITRHEGTRVTDLSQAEQGVPAHAHDRLEHGFRDGDFGHHPRAAGVERIELRELLV